jgi:hypothetical protein
MSLFTSNHDSTGDPQDFQFKSPGVFVRESSYDYVENKYVDKSTVEIIVHELRSEIEELKKRIETLENPEISKIRKEKIEKIFTEE